MVASKMLPVFGLLSLAAAHPASKRQTQQPLSANDVSVVQLAHYLENLEYALYSGGCDAYKDSDYEAAGVNATQANICTIAAHEKTHSDTLATLLMSNGVTPNPPCTYTFPYSDPKSFVDLANMITSVGIGAYLGGSELINDNPTLEENSGSILTVEARHDAYLRSAVGGSPFPNAFDTGLTALFAFSAAQMFVVSCPEQLPLVTLPTLKATAPPPSPDLVPVPAGTTIDFMWDPTKFFVPVDPNAPLYIAMINQNISAPIFQQVTSTGTGTGSVPLPEGVAGAAFAILTTFSGGLTENDLSQFGTLAGPAEVIVS